MPFRVLIVDDSMLVRQIVGDVLRKIPDVEVVGEARNGKLGLEMIQDLKPDLAILDIEMPVMDGLTLLQEKRKIGNLTPVMMLSSLTQAGADVTFQALQYGALEFCPKPSGETGIRLDDLQNQIESKVTGLILSLQQPSASTQSASGVRLSRHSFRFQMALIGASTGGPHCLHELFSSLKADFPLPLVVVQHMPPIFTAAFAQRLDRISGVSVAEAKDGAEMKPGHAYVAPGGRHLAFRKQQHRLYIELDDESPPYNAHKPSVDFTLNKALDLLDGEILALIMTGMGRDGVDGLTRLQKAGGVVLAQDEASSIVFGMNRRAIEAGVVDEVHPLAELGPRLQELAHAGALKEQ
jgi:two-component system chemotaxis response regulator CheB